MLPRHLVLSVGVVAAGAVLLASTSSTAAAPAAPFAEHRDGDVVAATFTSQPSSAEESAYDGAVFTTDAPDTTALPTIHTVYLHPSDVPSSFATYAGHFQGEDRRQSRSLQSVTGMSLRWDERIGEDGKSYHDITVLKARATSRKLTGSRQFSVVLEELAAAGLNRPDKKYLVWVDATSKVCGQSQLLQDTRRAPDNKSNGTTVSVNWRSGDRTAANGGFCAATLHELGHATGAVSTSAPNYASGHCDDHGGDLMCVGTNAQIPHTPGGPRYWDYGADDYLDPAADVDFLSGSYPAHAPDGRLGWWTMNLSRFLCPRSSADPLVADCSKPNQPVY